MRASSESGGKDLLQFSQVGLSSNILSPFIDQATFLRFFLFWNQRFCAHALLQLGVYVNSPRFKLRNDCLCRERSIRETERQSRINQKID